MLFFRKELLLIIAITLFACGNGNGQKKKNYSLSGQISNTASNTLYLLDLLNPNGGPVDTAYIDENGNFGFDYQPSQKSFYRISLSENFNLVLPLSSKENITLIGDAQNSDNIQIKGSKDVQRMVEVNNVLKVAYEQQERLNQSFQQYANSPKKDSIIQSFRNQYQEIEEAKINEFRSMIDQDPSLFANLAVMEQMPSESAEDLAYYKKVESALEKSYGNSTFYINFKARVDNLSRFAPGSEVPEINLPDPDGNLVALSSLRGKVVLIDFWAAWCKPCRGENPNVVAAYNKFKDKGFTVYGVSLDRTKEAWVNAIQQDGLTWTHVSDLKFWNSKAAKDYGVSGIPFAVLIDKNGKVIGKNLRGEALHQKLAEVLN